MIQTVEWAEFYQISFYLKKGNEFTVVAIWPAPCQLAANMITLRKMEIAKYMCDMGYVDIDSIVVSVSGIGLVRPLTVSSLTSPGLIVDFFCLNWLNVSN